MTGRAIILALALLACAGVVGHASKTESVPLRESLDTFPAEIDEWQGQSAGRFDRQVLTVLRVDDYLNRVYAAPAHTRVGLYIGFYQSQREGDTIHSPLNCLPGAGWQPMTRERIAVPVSTVAGLAPGSRSSGREIIVNRLLVQKGLDRQVVVYWYQSHGRVVASEYWGKIYTVWDAIRSNRTDAAMIRIMAPVSGNDEAAERRAEDAATAFTRAVFPLLGRYLPN